MVAEAGFESNKPYFEPGDLQVWLGAGRIPSLWRICSWLRGEATAKAKTKYRDPSLRSGWRHRWSSGRM